MKLILRVWKSTFWVWKKNQFLKISHFIPQGMKISAVFPWCSGTFSACTQERTCSGRACMQGALIRRERTEGVETTPWVPGGNVWHSWWVATIGRILLAMGHACRVGHAWTLGLVQRLVTLSKLLLQWQSEALDCYCVESGDYRNTPDNGYSQGGQELNASAGVCWTSSLANAQGPVVACPPRTLLCAPTCSLFVHHTFLFTMGRKVTNTTLSTILVFTIALIVQYLSNPQLLIHNPGQNSDWHTRHTRPVKNTLNNTIIHNIVISNLIQSKFPGRVKPQFST